jgi:hypothetical protein
MPYEDGFVVFVRRDRRHTYTPEAAELALGTCPTYAEARRMRRSLGGSPLEFVIRYVGETGGGD